MSSHLSFWHESATLFWRLKRDGPAEPWVARVTLVDQEILEPNCELSLDESCQKDDEEEEEAKRRKRRRRRRHRTKEEMEEEEDKGR